MTEEERIGEHTVGHLLGVARRHVEQRTTSSAILDTRVEQNIPKLNMGEVKSGDVLGRGGFCVVREVVEITLQDGDIGEPNARIDVLDEFAIQQYVQDRPFMAKHYLRKEKGTKKGERYRYAIKKVQNESKTEAQHYVNAVVDLATEARFLAVIRHPNIIKMRAMEDASFYTPGFFLVLDKLYDIMPTRLKKWKKKKGGTVSNLLRSDKKKTDLWKIRVSVAYDLSCAISYLHARSVIYRDLKPDNIGFDVRDDVKIFDFGLAKELRDDERNADGLFNMTGCTGSIRYMSPENIQCKPYNLKTDVYSWAMIMWNILALEPPFAMYTEQMIIDRVCNRGYRPKVFSTWSARISKIVSLGWSPDINKRPSFAEISAQLISEYDEINSNN
mmetsp:Transcript_28296/g.60853  ORF Transcript_28296/g.60853 Transcript_28296/m.60853 type:complete len:387 (-) Transcript_28296:2054-3214(-)